ncbi:MAG: DNA repair protein RadC [Candidatus Omnitrophica bacterium]|jgi:DNA repair protein RadC|nr:DNA repair protein RadC [Candidatus Omnitrophota bacterium]
MAIKSWPAADRPREKLFKSGEHSLSNTELLAILLASGARGQSAIELARKILLRFGNFSRISQADIKQLRGFKGLGLAKIAQVKAALEIGRRFGEEKIGDRRPRIESSKDVALILMPRMRSLKKEVFKALLLNSQNRLIDIVEIEEGTVNQAHPIIREVFQKALEHFAASLICLHNHPSGDSQPSREDKEFTKRLVAAGEMLEVKVLDHLIFGENSYFSFLDKGLL